MVYPKKYAMNKKMLMPNMKNVKNGKKNKNMNRPINTAAPAPVNFNASMSFSLFMLVPVTYGIGIRVIQLQDSHGAVV